MCESSDHHVDGSVTPGCCHPPSLRPLKRTLGGWGGGSFSVAALACGCFFWLLDCFYCVIERAAVWHHHGLKSHRCVCCLPGRCPRRHGSLISVWGIVVPSAASLPSAAIRRDLSVYQRQIPTNGPLLLSRWMSGGMRSCRGLGGPASGLGADAASWEGSGMVAAHSDDFMPGDVGQLIVASPIAQKGRVNRQETHQR